MINLSKDINENIIDETPISMYDAFQIKWKAGYTTTFIATVDGFDECVPDDCIRYVNIVSTSSNDFTISTRIIKECRTFADEFAMDKIETIEPIKYIEMNFG